MITTVSARRRLRGIAAGLVLATALPGCTSLLGTDLSSQKLGVGEVPTLLGAPVRDNRTPMDGALACFGDHMLAKAGRPLVIGVGDVKDYTGKYSINEGNAITQGGSLMVYSALGKIGGRVTIAERFDPTIAERELGYTDRRQLGDGEVHEVGGNPVPWLPYFGGSITRSDYFIVGGITELNYNIRSGGAQVAINNIGPEARVFTQNVAVDLRIVDSKSLVVVKTVSLTKQFTGYEVGANVFRFFGLDLFDINIGAKGQEPLQLGIRAALEEATMKLVGAVDRTDPDPCMSQRLKRFPEGSADDLRGLALPRDANGRPVVADPQARPGFSLAPGASLNAGSPGAAGVAGGEAIQILFEFGDVNPAGSAQAVLDRIAQIAATQPVDVMLVARETETWDPAKRDRMIDERIAALVTTLANRGIAPAAIGTVWRPDRADTSIHRDGPGLQEIAKIRVRG